MAKPMNVTLPDSIVSIPLPKGAGKVDVLLSKLPASIIFALAAHGAKQKAADTAVGHYTKADRPKPKEGDVIFDTPDALAKAIRARATTLLSRWEDGEFNLPGSGPRIDPVFAEASATILRAGGFPAAEWSALRKEGIEAVAKAFVLRKAEAKGVKLTPKAAQEHAKAVADREMKAAQIRMEAQAASIAALGELDLTI